MKKLTLAAYAKVNLFFQITGRKKSGYHEVATLLQSVSLKDDVALRTAPFATPFIELTVDGHAPDDSSNLAWQAANAFLQRTGLSLHIQISLKKRIPARAGLGGGSADAAAVLVGLHHLWPSALTEDQLLELGGSLGADIPFCMTGGSRFARGIGADFQPVAPIPPCTLVLAKPALDVGTPEAFELYDHAGVTEDLARSSRFLQAWESRRWPVIAPEMYNSFQWVVNPDQTADIAQRLESLGAIATNLSGSGSTVVGVFLEESTGQRAAAHLAEQGIPSFVVQPVDQGVKVE